MQDARSERTGWIGTGIGYCSWAVVLLLVAMACGAWGAVLEVGLPCLLWSLGLWQLTVLAVHAGRRAFGPGTREARAALLGSLFTSIGMLLFVANEYALPILLEDPGVRRLLSATGSATHMPSILEWLFLAVGVGLLALPVWRLLGRGAH